MNKGLCILIFVAMGLCTEASEQKFFMMSQYKGGTHLLLASLLELTGRDARLRSALLGKAPLVTKSDRVFAAGLFVAAHKMQYTEWQQLIAGGYKFLYIVRDPRDRLISRIYYRFGGYPKEQQFRHLTDTQVKQIIRKYIRTGHFHLDPFPEGIPAFFLAEEFRDRTLLIYFEDLVGSQGGGSDDKQQETLEKINDFLNLEYSTEELVAIGQKLFGHARSQTFRKGQIGKWKEYFDEQMTEAYRKKFGHYLQQLGYE